jgi:membrane protease YdiL (CAAX protease family)
MADLAPLLFPVWSFYAVPWLLGAATALAVRFVGRPWHQGIGLGIMAIPVWDTLWGILDSFGPLLQGGFVLRAYSEYQLSGFYSHKLLEDLGYLTLGFLVYASKGSWSTFWSATPRRLARYAYEAGIPMGNRSEASSAWVGLLLFPVLILSTVLFSLLTADLDSLRQSDESNVFANMTIYHALLLSLAAGFGEELLYRGFLQPVLARRMPLLVAIVVQAVFFGFAHSGYGTWIHVLQPALFGLVAGLVAWRFGLWAAIVLHVLVDIVAFGLEASRNVPWADDAVLGLLLANLLLSTAWALGWLVKQIQKRAGPHA